MACVKPCSIDVFEAGYMAKTKDEVLKFFINHGVLKDVIVCRCGNTLKMDGKMTFRCNKMVLRKKRAPKKCGFCISARKGTFLENSKLAIDKIFLLVNLLLNWRPPRQEAALEELGISSTTMVDWYSYCREVFISFAINNSTKLGGPGSTLKSMRPNSVRENLTKADFSGANGFSEDMSEALGTFSLFLSKEGMPILCLE
uniref:Uncharacterized protein LOC114340202 n=1 Tax=Diabrotica virgifera virgifera TaxID=50390 RepID=A0A6P7GBJ2_DIAVI